MLYDISGDKIATNQYGRELIVDSSGRITTVREYGNTTQYSVPNGGFILSAHAEYKNPYTGSGIENKGKVGMYVGINYDIGVVTIYDSSEEYLTASKYVNSGSTYGELPTPTKSNAIFDGWYTQKEGGNRITADSVYSASTLYAHWIETNYTISYNANGGTGAPASQTKTNGTALTLSSTKPTRTGYTFQGWATSANGTVAYQPGASYTADAAVTLYAVWKIEDVPVTPANNAVLSVSSGYAKPGDTVKLTVSLAGNPGLMFLQMKFDYDKTLLEAPVIEAVGDDTGWQFGTGASWGGSKDEFFEGEIITLAFKVKDNAPEGKSSVTISLAEAFNENEDEIVMTVTPGTITVSRRIPGDATGDGKVNGLDAIRIQKYLAGQNVTIDLNNADVTGDGKVNGLDYIRLMKYFAGQNVELK